MPGSATPSGKPIAGAEVDVWHSSTEGFYENQDPVQADMNLRGKFTTDKDGHISFRSVKPAGYPIPIDGPVGELLRAAGRHNMRPAHLHFLTYKPGFKTLISQIYDPEDKNIETDVQFGVTRHLIGNYVRHDEARAGAPDVKAAVVFDRAHFRHGKRHGALAEAADHRQGARRTAGDSASRTGVARVLPPHRGRETANLGRKSCDAEHCSKALPPRQRAGYSPVRARRRHVLKIGCSLPIDRRGL